MDEVVDREAGAPPILGKALGGGSRWVVEPFSPTPESLNLLNHTSETISMSMTHDGSDDTLVLRTAEVGTNSEVRAPLGLLGVMSKRFTLLVERIVGSTPRPNKNAVNVVMGALEVPQFPVDRPGGLGEVVSRYFRGRRG